MKRLAHATTLMALITIIASVNACASAGGGRESRCGATPGDTIYRPVGMVYRPCAVDREARLTSTQHANFTPNTSGGQSCYSAQFEFVVDESGKPIMRTVRATRSNDRGFENSVSELIPGLIYEPAMKDGQTVKQIATFSQTASVAKVAVPLGQTPRPPAQRPPAC